MRISQPSIIIIILTNFYIIVISIQFFMVLSINKSNRSINVYNTHENLIITLLFYQTSFEWKIRRSYGWNRWVDVNKKIKAEEWRKLLEKYTFKKISGVDECVQLYTNTHTCVCLFVLYNIFHTAVPPPFHLMWKNCTLI